MERIRAFFSFAGGMLFSIPGILIMAFSLWWKNRQDKKAGKRIVREARFYR